MSRLFPRAVLLGAVVGQAFVALACGDLLDRPNPSREEPRGGSAASSAAPEQGGAAPSAPPSPNEPAPGSVPPGASPSSKLPPPNTPSELADAPPPIVPLGPHARTEDEDNSIAV